MLKKQIAELGVPEVPDFLDQIVAAADTIGLPDVRRHDETRREDFRDDVEGIITAADFIELTNGAQLLFI
jgi:hypothetical protein